MAVRAILDFRVAEEPSMPPRVTMAGVQPSSPPPFGEPAESILAVSTAKDNDRLALHYRILRFLTVPPNHYARAAKGLLHEDARRCSNSRTR
jgi:hypothetical protein